MRSVHRNTLLRLPFGSLAELYVLDGSSGPWPAVIVESSNTGLVVAVPDMLRSDQAVRVDVPDATIYCEVCVCRREPSGRVLALLNMRQVLRGLKDLQPLLRALQPDREETAPVLERRG